MRNINQPIFVDYLKHPYVGTVKPIGHFNEGDTLTFYLESATPNTVCAGAGTFRSNEPIHAQVEGLGTDRWRIYWEDHPGDKNDPPGGDFNDLVVRVERIRELDEPDEPTNPLRYEP